MTAFNGISTLSTLDAAILNGTAVQYGIDKINLELQKSLSFYNQAMNELVSDYAEPVNKQKVIFKGNDLTKMTKVDEAGRGRTVATDGQYEIGLPLEKFVANVGYTYDFLQKASVDEMSRKFLAMQGMHYLSIIDGIKSALFTLSTNYNFVDKYENSETLSVKGFWNADSSFIPQANDGTTFDGSTHTHYKGSTSGSASSTDIDGLIETIVEHNCVEKLMLIINKADVSRISAISGFTALSSDKLVYSGVTSTKDKLDLGNLDNRCIGLWRDATPIWVKPFGVKNYMACVSLDNFRGKPIAFRQHSVESLRGLRFDSHSMTEPLLTEHGIAYFGFGAYNRSAGAVLQLNNSTFTAPTL